jgi:DNA repair protein RecO (recombination protein O)
MNELLLKTLAREDPHPQLFDAYDQALRQLALGTSTNNVLRKFEWLFLQETGYGADEPMPDFDDPIQAAQAKQLLRRRIVEHFELNRLATREVMQSLMPFITSRSTAIPSID